MTIRAGSGTRLHQEWGRRGRLGFMVNIRTSGGTNLHQELERTRSPARCRGPPAADPFGRFAPSHFKGSSLRRSAELNRPATSGPTHVQSFPHGALAANVRCPMGSMCRDPRQGCTRRRPGQPGAARGAARRRAIGQAPFVVFEITVVVTSVVGSWVLRNDTPASMPSSWTASPGAGSQKPRP